MRITKIFIVTLTFIVISLPLFGHFWTSGDLSAHYYRLISIKHQLETHQFPMYFDFVTDNMQGYGYSWNLFYPPLTAFLYTIIDLLSFNSIDAVIQLKISIAIISVINFFIMYFSVKRIFNSSQIAFISAILSVTSYYFLYNQYTRSAFPEALAMSFVPLLLLGLFGYINNNKNKIYLPLSFSLILLTNIPATIVTLIFITLFVVIFHKKFIEQYRDVILHSFIVIGITSFFILPLYYTSKGDIYAFTSMKSSYESMWKLTIPVINLIIPTRTTEYPFRLITPGWVIIGLIIALFTMKKNGDKLSSMLDGHHKVAISISLLFIIMCSQMFPWNHIPKQLPVLNFIQFPWRMMLISSPILCIFAALTLVKIAQESQGKKGLIYIVIFSSIILSMYASTSPFDNKARLPWYQVYLDYMPNNMARKINEIKKTKKEPIVLSGNGSIVSARLTGGYPTYKYICMDDCTIQLPVIPYRGYEVEGVKSFSENNMGLMQVNVSKGSGQINLKYNPIIIYISYGITLITIILLLYFTRRKS